MKKSILLIILSALLLSCATDPREELISDYEQIIDGTKTDLDLKVIDLIELGTVTAQDSLSILLPEFIEKRDNKIKTIQESIEKDKEQIEYYKDQQKKFGMSYKEMIEMYEQTIEISKNSINIYQTDCKGSFLEWHYNRIQELKKDTSKILCNKVRATYSIKNPVLNFAKQELTKVYMFSPNNDSILGVIE